MAGWSLQVGRRQEQQDQVNELFASCVSSPACSFEITVLKMTTVVMANKRPIPRQALLLYRSVGALPTVCKFRVLGKLDSSLLLTLYIWSIRPPRRRKETKAGSIVGAKLTNMGQTDHDNWVYLSKADVVLLSKFLLIFGREAGSANSEIHLYVINTALLFKRLNGERGGKSKSKHAPGRALVHRRKVWARFVVWIRPVLDPYS